MQKYISANSGGIVIRYLQLRKKQFETNSIVMEEFITFSSNLKQAKPYKYWFSPNPGTFSPNRKHLEIKQIKKITGYA
ncbi:MAG: hypothetical protein MSA91_05135 [Lachnobacterium sp.]|nr:hypothetical protein [Lachnobacterium sp.]